MSRGFSFLFHDGIHRCHLILILKFSPFTPLLPCSTSYESIPADPGARYTTACEPRCSRDTETNTDPDVDVSKSLGRARDGWLQLMANRSTSPAITSLNLIFLLVFVSTCQLEFTQRQYGPTHSHTRGLFLHYRPSTYRMSL
jgi:hypothetical protein